MRLIDADALENVVQSLNKKHTKCITNGEQEYFSNILHEFPTIDAVPIIRCKDCKKNGNTLCPMLFTEMKDTDYCSYAERKEE